METDGWHQVILGHVCVKIGSGATPRGGKKVYHDHGSFSLIRSQNVYNEGFRKDGLVYISDKEASRLSNVEVKPDDVLLNITGDSVARCCQAEGSVLPGRVNQHVAIIRPDSSKLDCRFLRYYLVSPDAQSILLSLAAAGATRNALTKGMIESLEILAPSNIAEQRAIAHILGTLDDMIELNRQMNETLESMARAIFKSWFIDFEPVRAKMEGRKLFGMDEETSALFPNSFEDSALGEIPKGWKVGRLSEIINVNPGFRLEMKSTAPYVGMASLEPNNMRVAGIDEREVGSGSRFRNGDTLVARITPCLENGKTVFIDNLPVGSVAVGSTEFIVLESRPPFPQIYSYLLARTDAFRSYAIQNMTGTSGRQRVPTEAISGYEVLIPDMRVAVRFGEMIDPLIEKGRMNLDESNMLTKIRDLILPKLISGEIRIKPQAEVGMA